MDVCICPGTMAGQLRAVSGSGFRLSRQPSPKLLDAGCLKTQPASSNQLKSQRGRVQSEQLRTFLPLAFAEENLGYTGADLPCIFGSRKALNRSLLRLPGSWDLCLVDGQRVSTAMQSLQEQASQKSGVPLDEAFKIDEVNLYERLGHQIFVDLSTNFYTR